MMQHLGTWTTPGMIVALLAAALTLASGCKTTPTGADPMDAYQAGRYPEALAAAREQADAATGADRQRNRYIAGMSAYRLNKDDEALRYLTAVTSDSTSSIAGPAAATAGLIYARNNKPTQALPYFEQATRRLTGEDLAQAYFHLGSTQQKVGLWSQGKSNLEKAVSLSGNASFKDAVRQRMSSTSFALQVGSFSQLANAEKEAATLRAAALKNGYGAPRVVPANNGGAIAYLVHVGLFPTYDAAIKAKGLLGKSDAIVVDTKP